jgi:hypothetical protein
MATNDFILKPGEPAPENIRTTLERLLSPGELEQLTQRGARVRIIVTSPWPKPPRLVFYSKIAPWLENLQQQAIFDGAFFQTSKCSDKF